MRSTPPIPEAVAGHTRAVPRVAPPGDVSALRRLVRDGEPRVLEGFAREWPAVTTWTIASLAARAGDWHVPVARTDGRVLHTDLTRGLEHDEMAFASFVASLERLDGEGYLSLPAEQVPATLRTDIAPPTLLRESTWLRSKLWIGGEGVISPMHWDLPQNVHVQVVGAKRFTLAAPGQWRRLYPFPWWSGIANRSYVDPEGDLSRDWPRFRTVERWVAELSPGDAIFIPTRWWHHVRTVRPSVSVNYWWGEGLVAAAAWASDQVKRWRGISR